MIIKGQKRKLPPENPDLSDCSSPTWESQRQFVFSVSLSKYHHGQELPEPSLRRSVLIANTLRQINLEVTKPLSVDKEVLQPCHSFWTPLQEKESGNIFTAITTAKCHSAGTAAESKPSFDSCPMISSNALLNGSLCVEDEDWGWMSNDPEFSLSAAISSIVTALDSNIDGNLLAASRTPLRSLENLSGPSESGVAGVKQGIRSYGSSWEHQEEYRSRESSMEVTSNSYLSDVTVEDLFQHIDASVLEKDMGMIGFRGSEGGNPASVSPSLYPLSVSLNQNLKCLPSFSSLSPFSSSSSLSLSPLSSFSGQNHVPIASSSSYCQKLISRGNNSLN